LCSISLAMLVIIQVALSMTVLAPHKGLASSASEVANEVRSESDFFSMIAIKHLRSVSASAYRLSAA
jgi:hypothetical protein